MTQCGRRRQLTQWHDMPYLKITPGQQKRETVDELGRNSGDSRRIVCGRRDRYGNLLGFSNPTEPLSIQDSTGQSQMYSAYVQFHKNQIPECLWRAYMAYWMDKLQIPGFQLVWADTKHVCPDKFCQCLDEIKKNPMVAA